MNFSKKILLLITLISQIIINNVLCGNSNDYYSASSRQSLKSALKLPIISYFVPVTKEGVIQEYIYKIDDFKAEQQAKAIELAIQKGEDLDYFVENQYQYFPFAALYTHRELLLRYISPNNFVKLVLKANISSLTGAKDQFSQTLAKQQTELLELAVQRGANLNQIFDEWTSSIDIYTLYVNKDLLLTEIGASKFLILTVNSTIRKNSYNEAMQFELAQLAIDLGADPNFILSDNLAIRLSYSFDNYIGLLQLLVSSGANRCINEADLEEMQQSGLGHLIDNPQLGLDQKYKNLNVSEGLEAKMPHIVHHIWLTHPDSPREIRAVDVANVIATKKTFAKSTTQWEHILWTNDPCLLPKSVAALEEAGIQVKSIYEHKKDLKLFELIESLINEKLWGKASDVLRLSLSEHFGGIYADLNYIFNRDVTTETYKYNFFTTTFSDIYIANFFFGNSPGHPILKTALLLAERNLLTPPEYIKSRKDKNSVATTSITTANPIFLAYYLESNQNGNIDVIYPALHITKRHLINNENAYDILKRVCPMITFYDYIQFNDICGSEAHFIGRDGENGGTWLSDEL